MANWKNGIGMDSLFMVILNQIEKNWLYGKTKGIYDSPRSDSRKYVEVPSFYIHNNQNMDP